MNAGEYTERKKTILKLIKKAKSANIELGEYLEKHFVIDDKNRTLVYTGVASALESLVKESSF